MRKKKIQMCRMSGTMEYLFNNNGIEIKATYSDEEINTVFIPLLEHLSEMRSRKGWRLIVMLAAPPGAGKSTLSSYLEYLSGDVISGMKVQAIGMDGFHRYQDYLISHTADINGRKVPMVDIKGAPVTFDIEQFKIKLREIASGKNCGCPEDEAVAFVEFSDMANVKLCLEKTGKADLELMLSEKSGYSKFQ